MKTCAECDERYFAKGLCVNHYYVKKRRENPQPSRQAVKRWKKSNKAAARVHNLTYKARKKCASGRHTKSDIETLMVLQRNRCVVCHDDISKIYEVDHIIPLARGGSNDKRNIQLLCPSCNRRKQARDPIDFMQDRGFLI